ncbi:MaoC/PaaZ C-terminal domain-containing protein [Angustibacter peucedani]
MRTITLERDPHLAVLMTRATATAAGRGGSVPDVEVVRRGVAVDRDHLAAYDRVCGFAVRDALPSTYVHVLTFGLQLTLMAEPEYPLPLPGVVHVGQRIEVLRPVTAEERLDLAIRAEHLRPHPRGRQVDLVGTASVDGELVWRGRSTYLAKGAPPSGGEGATDGETSPPVTFPDDVVPAARFRLPKDLGRRYAAVSGDVNPIHLNPLTAKAFGFPRAIAHGMWTMARCLSALESWTPEAQVAEVEFRRPVLLPSTVELRTRPADGGYDVQLASPSRGGARRTEHLRGTVRPTS